MALTVQQQNFASDLMTLAASERAVQLQAKDIVARYNNNGFSTIATVDLAAYAPTAHLTQLKVQNCVGAINAIATALGDDVTGQAVNLIEMKG